MVSVHPVQRGRCGLLMANVATPIIVRAFLWIESRWLRVVCEAFIQENISKYIPCRFTLVPCRQWPGLLYLFCWQPYAWLQACQQHFCCKFGRTLHLLMCYIPPMAILFSTAEEIHVFDVHHTSSFSLEFHLQLGYWHSVSRYVGHHHRHCLSLYR